jgi:hypothetical protein
MNFLIYISGLRCLLPPRGAVWEPIYRLVRLNRARRGQLERCGVLWLSYERCWKTVTLQVPEQRNVCPGALLQTTCLGGPYFSTTVGKEAGKTRRSNSILYEECGNVLFIIIIISYLVLFFWIFSSTCQHIPQLFYRSSCWDHSQPFCCFSICPAVAVHYRYSVYPLFPAH